MLKIKQENFELYINDYTSTQAELGFNLTFNNVPVYKDILDAMQESGLIWVEFKMGKRMIMLPGVYINGTNEDNGSYTTEVLTCKPTQLI